MRIFIIDTEYLSWKKDEWRNNNLRRLLNPPEIIQIYLKELFINKKNDCMFYIRPIFYKKYPHRISKLTKIKKSFLDKNGIDFITAYKKIKNFLPNKSLIITNGNDFKILERNIEIHKIMKSKKVIYFIDLNIILKTSKLFVGFRDKFISSTDIKKKINLSKISNHNAINDVEIFNKTLIKLRCNPEKIINLKKNFKFFSL